MAQLVRMLTNQADHLSLVPENSNGGRREPPSPSCLLISTHVLPHKINKYNFKTLKICSQMWNIHFELYMNTEQSLIRITFKAYNY